MRTLALAALLGLSALALGADKKDVEVKVKFPKTMKIEKRPVAGGKTAEFEVEIEVKNVSRKAVEFSSADVDVKVVAKGLKKNMVGVEKSRDALLLQPGKTLTRKQKVTINTLVPDNGDKFKVEVTVSGHKKTGTVTAKK